MRVALAQLNPIVGDIAGNLRMVIKAIDAARSDAAELVVFSEMAMLGYPPRDLILRSGVAEACEEAVRQAAAHAGDLAIVVGHPRPREVEHAVRQHANSASFCAGGRVQRVYDKRLLPGYDVFDEDRYFEPGSEVGVVDHVGRRIGLLICEDLWRAGDVSFMRQYASDPVADLANERCDVVVALNATPFVVGKWARHLEQLRAAAKQLGCPIVSVNQVGGNDDLIFDGRSVVVAPRGEMHALPGWQASVQTVDTNIDAASAASVRRTLDMPEPMHELYHTLVLGVRDYVHKTGNKSVVLGLSGGIDSALVATLAVAALGPGRVTGITMPSRYSSAGSCSDSEALVANLGMNPLLTVPIDAVHTVVSQTMREAITGELANVADENTQARLRGVILMARSNTTGELVLATGNKSELATGYCTLYGDMCGALCVIGDVVKTRVYALAKWINANFAKLGFAVPPIPVASISKAPSAELKANQTDQDTLPPYEVLDEIVMRVVEREQSAAQIIAETGFDATAVHHWVRVIDQQEYKRAQAALVLKVSPRTFGRGRPMPMAAKSTVPAVTHFENERATSRVSTPG